MVSRPTLVCIALLCGSPAHLAQAQEALSAPVLLECQSAKGESFSIELFSETRWGPMHCVEGLGIMDMTACAPDGGWGLSLPTGQVPIADVTSSWAVATQHMGGKFYARLGPDRFEATATFSESLEADLSAGSGDYVINLNRSDGQGFYATGGGEKVGIECQVTERKF